MKLTRAQQNRLMILAKTGKWSGSWAERELALFDGLVEFGMASMEYIETKLGGEYCWLGNRYHPTDEGKQEAERLKLERAMKGMMR
jgi:hypothetical protein